jgi:hypothetical protein
VYALFVYDAGNQWSNLPPLDGEGDDDCAVASSAVTDRSTRMPASRPLYPSRFSFRNFGDRMADVEKSMASLTVHTGTPTTEVIEGGVVVPAKMPPKTSTGPVYASNGGVVDAAGQPVESVHLRRSGRLIAAGLAGPVPVESIGSVREVDEEVVYLGWLQPHHYGHFLLESLARLWFLREIDPAIRVVFHQYSVPPQGPTRRILELMGIPDERLLIPRVRTRFRRIVIPEVLYELSLTAHERFVEPFREIAECIVGASPTRPSTQPVYLSRRQLPKGRREVFGESELEEVLRENGFRIAYPEQMPIDEQILLFNEHSDIFAAVGSAAHAILFSLNQPRLHLLTAGCPKPDYFLVSDVAEVPTTLVHCLGEPGYVTAPQLLDIPLVLAYLDECGLLTRRPSSDLMERLPNLQRRYDETATSFRVRQATLHGESLSETLQAEAEEWATTSWVVSWVLARHYAKSDTARAAAFAEQCAGLLLAETDRAWIDRFGGTGTSVVPVVRATAAARGYAAAERLVAVLVARGLIDAPLRARAEQTIREATKSGE